MATALQAYVVQEWTNYDASTPFSGDRMDHIEAGIAAATTAIRTSDGVYDYMKSKLGAGHDIALVEADGKLVVRSTAPTIVSGNGVNVAPNDDGTSLVISSTLVLPDNSAAAIRGSVLSLLAPGNNVNIHENTANGTIVVGATEDAAAVRQTLVDTLVGGTNVTISPLVENKITVNAVVDPEVVRDTVGATLKPGPGIVLTVDDAANTISIAGASGAAALPAPTGGDDTAMINQFLADYAGSHIIGLFGSTYTITNPLVMRSGTWLDMTSCVVNYTGIGTNLVNNYAVSISNRNLADANTTVGSATITSATAAFTSADIGRSIVVPVAGGAPATGQTTPGPLVGTILTVVDASTVTIDHTATRAVVAGPAYIYTRDHDIKLTGGTWNRNNSIGAGTNMHSILFRHVDVLDISGLTVTTLGGKYAINVGDVTRVTAGNIHFRTDSDGFHVQGPASTIIVRDISGVTGDDSVAVTARDYATYNDTQGNVSGVIIDGVRTVLDDSANVKIIGGTGCKLRDIIVRNIQSTGTVRGVAVIDDQVGSTDINGLLIDGVSVTLVDSPNARAVDIQVGAGKNGTVRNVSFNGVSSILIGVLVGTWDSIDISNIATSTAIAACDLIRTGGTIGVIKCSGLYARFSDGTSNVFSTGTGTVIGRCIINDVDSVGGRDVFSISNSITQLITNNITVSSGSRLANVSTTVDWTLNNFYAATLTNAAIYVSATAVLTLRGSGTRRGGTWQGFQRQATQTIYCYNPDFPADLALLTHVPVTAPMLEGAAWNTNTALSCGAGRVVDTGYVWKNPISRAAYPSLLTQTWNADGTLATKIEDGVTTTYTYNGDGTIATETRAGKVKTYTYDTGRLTQIAGA